MHNSFSWVNEKLKLQETTSGAGRGVFAAKKIMKGEVLAIFGGYVMTIKEEKEGPANLSDYGLQIGDDFVLGIKKESEIEPACFFNHSCDPNAGFHGQIILVAMREILVGEAVTFDYAMALGSESEQVSYSLNCLCASKNCRNIITDQDWKNKELQKRYKGYFQWYLQEKINRQVI